MVRGDAGLLPDFLIIGAAKSGTTSLAAWLGAHQDVFIPPEKELHFFTNEERWARGLESYTSAFADAGARRAAEATPSYLALEVAAARLVSTVPDAPLIAILREPVDRAWAHYCYDRDLGKAPPPFDEIAASVGREDEHRYLKHGRYVRHLRRYAALVPREQLLVLWFEDLRDRPEATWREVCGFLALDPDPVPSVVGSTFNQHYRLRAPALQRAVTRAKGRVRLPFGLGTRIYGLLRSEGGYEPLAPEIRDRLRSTYAEDNRELSGWLGRPLPDGWPR